MNILELLGNRSKVIDAEHAHPGHDTPLDPGSTHHVLHTPLQGPVPPGHEELYIAAGCFWGIERAYWQQPGIHTTAVGYAGGHSPHPHYREVCSGTTGHTETVRIVYNPEKISTEQLLKLFWESHNPTQGMRQGNDVGTQYRSMILTTTPEQAQIAETTRTAYQTKLHRAGYGKITTEIRPLETFYYAEAEHQQYLSKNPWGYCGAGGTGISCPVGITT